MRTILVEALETHAAASDAISLLQAHIPEPDLGEDPEELMAQAVEPGVSSQQEVLPVPRTSVPHFRVLDEVLDSALALADCRGLPRRLRSSPSSASCDAGCVREVSGQANGEPPTSWVARPGRGAGRRAPADLVEGRGGELAGTGS